MATALIRVAALLVLLSNPAGAATEDIPAQAIVRETTEKVLKALREEGDSLKTQPDRLYALIDQLILPRFDFERMSRWVLGPHWRVASEPQRTEFVRAFRDLLVQSYSQALLEYRNRKVEFLTPRINGEDEVTVRGQVDQGGGPMVPVSWEVARVDGDWKVYDIKVDGVSLVINYRSSFSQEIQRNGLDKLIERLKERNATRSG